LVVAAWLPSAARFAADAFKEVLEVQDLLVLVVPVVVVPVVVQELVVEMGAIFVVPCMAAS